MKVSLFSEADLLNSDFSYKRVTKDEQFFSHFEYENILHFMIFSTPLIMARIYKSSQ